MLDLLWAAVRIAAAARSTIRTDPVYVRRVEVVAAVRTTTTTDYRLAIFDPAVGDASVAIRPTTRSSRLPAPTGRMAGSDIRWIRSAVFSTRWPRRPSFWTTTFSTRRRFSVITERLYKIAHLVTSFVSRVSICVVKNRLLCLRRSAELGRSGHAHDSAVPPRARHWQSRSNGNVLDIGRGVGTDGFGSAANYASGSICAGTSPTRFITATSFGCELLYTNNQRCQPGR